MSDEAGQARTTPSVRSTDHRSRKTSTSAERSRAADGCHTYGRPDRRQQPQVVPPATGPVSAKSVCTAK